jgi:hypothetical protein
MSYTTCAQSAAKIRAAYKAQGWTPRQISVRADSYSMGSAVRIRVKDGSIPLHLAKSIAEPEEHIRRDGFGEILAGGNRYIDVSLTEEARELKARRYIEAVERAAALLNDPHDGVLQPIIKGYHIGHDLNGFLALWGETSHLAACTTAEGIALSLALAIEEGKR